MIAERVALEQSGGEQPVRGRGGVLARRAGPVPPRRAASARRRSSATASARPRRPRGAARTGARGTAGGTRPPRRAASSHTSRGLPPVSRWHSRANSPETAWPSSTCSTVATARSLNGPQPQHVRARLLERAVSAVSPASTPPRARCRCAQPPRDEREPVERRVVAECRSSTVTSAGARARRAARATRAVRRSARAGSSRRRATANGNSRSPASPPAASTVSPCAAARARARSSSAVRPLPGGPAMSTWRPRPARAMRIARSMAASSAARSRSRSDTGPCRVVAHSDPTPAPAVRHRAIARSVADATPEE